MLDVRVIIIGNMLVSRAIYLAASLHCPDVKQLMTNIKQLMTSVKQLMTREGERKRKCGRERAN